jgi:hypothetical protein
MHYTSTKKADAAIFRGGIPFQTLSRAGQYYRQTNIFIRILFSRYPGFA